MISKELPLNRRLKKKEESISILNFSRCQNEIKYFSFDKKLGTFATKEHETCFDSSTNLFRLGQK